MSISSEISRISGNVSAALTAIGNKGVTVPAGSNSDDLATLIGSIQTGGGTPSATAHTIVFEFSDETSTTLTGYWDGSFISDAIRATTPITYNGVTVESASLDNVAWYTKPSGTWETVWEGTSTPNTDGGEYFWITEMSAVDVARGSTWRITIDGTAYVCTAKQATIAYLGEWTVLGNPGQAGGTDDGSGVPFCFYNYNGQAFCGDTNLPVKSYSLKFERQISA